MKDSCSEQHFYGNYPDKEGVFNFASGMTENEVKNLVMYLTGVSGDDFYIKLYALLGKKMVAFISLFEGKSIKIYNLRYLLKAKHYCKVYNFIQSRGDSEETRRIAAETFRKRLSHINSVIAKVHRERAKVVNGSIELPYRKMVSDGRKNGTWGYIEGNGKKRENT